MADTSPLPYSREVARKGLHLLALSIPAGMWWVGMPLALHLLGAAAVLAVSADIARAYSAPFNRFIRTIFGPLMRAEELPARKHVVRFNGATCVLVGATLLALFFPLRLAIPVLATTMLADAAAALVGLPFGRHHWGPLSATVEGSAAFVCTGLTVMAFFPAVPFGAAAGGVVAGAAIEVLPLPVNDNIRVPLAVAVVVAALEAAVWGRPVSLFGGLAS